MARKDLRRNDEMRKIKITPNFMKHAEGSALIEIGGTQVICTASVSENLPPFLKGRGRGWIAAEYAMLPRSTNTRNRRDISKLRLSPRSSEIQRLIGRSLRSITDLEAMGELSIDIDCDVLCADGGTRCAAISGAFVALYLAFKKLVDEGRLKTIPLKTYISAISVGIIDGEPVLDLDYIEDSSAMVDLNFVYSGQEEIIEIQGTGEKRGFTDKELKTLMSYGKKACKKIMREQKKIVGIL